MNRIEGTKLIAKFLAMEKVNGTTISDSGLEVSAKGYYHLGKFFLEEELEYDSSWDWLMEVVDKIESLGFDFCIMDKAVFIRREFDYWETNNTFNKKKAVWDESVKFIKWYNNNKEI